LHGNTPASGRLAVLFYNPGQGPGPNPLPASVKLGDLIDALEEQSDSLFPYVDRETGEVFLISDESLSMSEWEPEEIAALPDWQKEEAEVARRIETTERYLQLPDRFELNEWKVMHDFCEDINHDETRARLLEAICGNRPFRRFKDEIGRLNMWDPWNRFRRAAFAETLRPWCEASAITLVTE
jgi:hypothetical protein